MPPESPDPAGAGVASWAAVGVAAVRSPTTSATATSPRDRREPGDRPRHREAGGVVSMVRIVPSPTTEACFPRWSRGSRAKHTSDRLGTWVRRDVRFFIDRRLVASCAPTTVRIAEPEGKTLQGSLSLPLGTRGADWAGAPRSAFPDLATATDRPMAPSAAWRSPGTAARVSGSRVARASWQPTPTVRSSGPTGRGLTADIVTFSHAEDESVAARGKAKDAGPRYDVPGRPSAHERRERLRPQFTR